MKVKINGFEMDVDDSLLLRELIRMYSPRQTGIAVVLNGSMVKRRDLDNCEITVMEGDQIDLVQFIGGG